MDSITYLGVTLNMDMKWSEHISVIAGNANKVLFDWLNETFGTVFVMLKKLSINQLFDQSWNMRVKSETHITRRIPMLLR